MNGNISNNQNCASSESTDDTKLFFVHFSIESTFEGKKEQRFILVYQWFCIEPLAKIRKIYSLNAIKYD